MSREGSLEAPTRHALAWQSEDFYDAAKLDAEMRRVFDICHGCRRCFNLCDSFPRLFELIDGNPSEDVEGVKSEDFTKVTEACTLCDMCFMTKCPYVPPHPWAVDFPHLMLRHRVVEAKKGKTDFTARQLAEMDRNGRLMGVIAPLTNWASKKENALTRPVMDKVLGIDADAELPKFARRSFMAEDKRAPITANPERARLRQEEGRALCHLLRQLQQARHRHGGARRAKSSWRRNARRLSRLLRHAVPGTGGVGQGRGAGREGFQRTLRPDR